ncbi:Hcp1 family type VI secretion system effector [Yersinia aldovae]|uniref:Hcp family type VI secretion system effector n=2 Tax=Yersinia aldovae TaxID=29483 RepID=UPI0005E12E44|nr:Hcp family type VI secretion system effector [Yersinia aldovae]CNI31009.1 Hcp1 family type VI secretion system effector [Yersinia aldovae]
MANLIYLTLNGEKQGLISSGCSTVDSIGNRFQRGHEDQIQVISLNHIITREQHASHHPLAFTKPIDKSTPLLGVSISNNELLDAEFSMYRTNASGAIEIFFSVKLTDAHIVDVSCAFPNSIENNSLIPYEKVLLKYKSISWEHKIAGTSGYSIWDDRVY